MDREQTKMIVRKIHAIYQNTFKMEDPTFVIDTWHDVLKDYDFAEISENLTNYMKTGAQFPPKVGQLIKTEKRDIAVLNVYETRQLLEHYEQKKDNVATREVANEWLSKMRETLGVKK